MNPFSQLPFGEYFPFFFILSWIAGLFLISKMGWSRLAAKYKTNSTFIGKKIWLSSATLNGKHYRNVILLKYNDEGIYLKPVFLFRLFHPPVFIPWGEIKKIRQTKMLFFKYKELTIGEPVAGTLGMENSAFARIENTFRSHNF